MQTQLLDVGAVPNEGSFCNQVIRGTTFDVGMNKMKTACHST